MAIDLERPRTTLLLRIWIREKVPPGPVKYTMMLFPDFASFRAFIKESGAIRLTVPDNPDPEEVILDAEILGEEKK